MLWELKRKIYEQYGNQWKFSLRIEEQPTYISQVVNERLKLPDEKKNQWAQALGCDVKELFE